jgi:hypothetical protein
MTGAYLTKRLRRRQPPDSHFENGFSPASGDHLKTAKTRDLEVPPTLLARADEVE